MHGERIDGLNEVYEHWEELNRDSLANKRVEVAIVTFNTDVQVVARLCHNLIQPPTLVAQGLTHRVHEALDMIEARKRKYRNNGVSYYRPWCF